MGQTLSEPVTEKETDFDENAFIYYGVSSMQGWRISMEDAHAAELDFAGDNSSAFFGVYDGHGGTCQSAVERLSFTYTSLKLWLSHACFAQKPSTERVLVSLRTQGKVWHYTRGKCYTRFC